MGAETGTPTTSGYAIATSNPTWTERVDTGSTAYNQAGATATRPEATATGNATATLSSSTNNTGQLLSIAPADNVSFEAPLFLQELTLYMVPPVVLPFHLAVSLFNVTVSKFTSLAKSASTWINQSKS